MTHASNDFVSSVIYLYYAITRRLHLKRQIAYRIVKKKAVFCRGKVDSSMSILLVSVPSWKREGDFLSPPRQLKLYMFNDDMKVDFTPLVHCACLEFPSRIYRGIPASKSFFKPLSQDAQLSHCYLV